MNSNRGTFQVSLFGMVIAIFIGIGLVSKEIEKRTLYTVLSRPVRRWEFIVGKFFGLAGTLVVNTFFMAVGVFAALYAGYLRPELRVTASQMSAVVNGIATILMFAFIDPYLSLMTDDVAAGKVGESYFRRSVVWLTGSRLVGTVLAQVILVPAALWIVALAEWL